MTTTTFQSFCVAAPTLRDSQRTEIVEYSYDYDALTMTERRGVSRRAMRATTVRITAEERSALCDLHANDFIEPARIFAAAESA